MFYDLLFSQFLLILSGWSVWKVSPPPIPLKMFTYPTFGKQETKSFTQLILQIHNSECLSSLTAKFRRKNSTFILTYNFFFNRPFLPSPPISSDSLVILAFRVLLFMGYVVIIIHQSVCTSRPTFLLELYSFLNLGLSPPLIYYSKMKKSTIN